MNYAGFWRRVAAFMIDLFITMTIPSFFSTGPTINSITSFGFSVLILFLYRPFFESSALQGTPGKALMNISVVSENGERITFKQACIRFFSSYLSMILYVGYFMQPFTARRQTLHDMIAETVVINNTTVNDMNYFTAWKNQFKSIMNKL